MKFTVKVDLLVSYRSLRAPSANDEDQQKLKESSSRSRLISRSPSASQGDLRASESPTETDDRKHKNKTSLARSKKLGVERAD
ncbi:hypothetical protein DPMN_078259 [Dreissena polymorpha]|uniref:Uncharacterized protein n=1 Tax=Dreissena polymorpha TaxID=45954 RepID=A0A9D3YS56_DREPO|nr:hypothetical protein DPMN_078259 [Dreissena polymorpha]